MHDIHIFGHIKSVATATAVNFMATVVGHETVENIEKVLEKVHLFHIRNRYPTSLSMGEKQRVSIVRAFINNPEKAIKILEDFGSPKEFYRAKAKRREYLTEQDIKNISSSSVVSAETSGSSVCVVSSVFFLPLWEVFFSSRLQS
mgnify:CR=1 FL=1